VNKKYNETLSGYLYADSDDEKNKRLVVMSFGCLCLTARFLGDLGVRTFAGPFDWIFSSPSMIEHVIRDSFSIFLERSLRSHTTYCTMLKRDTIYNHHDPLNEQDNAYFQRTVSRFNKVKNCASRKLFVMLSLKHRETLNDGELSSLFLSLVEAEIINFELVAVKIIISENNVPKECGSRQLVHVVAEGNETCELRVHELVCFGGLGAKGLTFLDERDKDALTTILFGSSNLSHVPIAHDPLGKPKPPWFPGNRASKYKNDGYMIATRYLSK